MARLRRLGPLAWAAGVYVLSWLAGLSVFSASTQVHSSGAQVLAAYAGHEGAGSAQWALTEGLPALMLGLVVLGCVRAARRAGQARLARVVLVTGAAAVTASLSQFVLGLVLTLRLVPDGDVRGAARTFAAISRLDGVKMLLLAGTAMLVLALVRRGALRAGRWMATVSIALAVSIAVTGVGYLLLLDGPAQAAWISLPLLLVWTSGLGVALDRGDRAA